MSVWNRLYRGETAFDFVGNRRRWFTLSGVMVAVAVLSLVFRWFNLSVDFEGGTIIESPNAAAASVEEFRTAVQGAGFEADRVQLIDEGARVRVQTAALDGAEQDLLTQAVAAAAGVEFDDVNVDAVGPTFGEEITRRAIEALLIFLGVVAIFIAWRFEWKMAAAALAALFHDLLITAGFYSLVGFEVTPATVIAILTILGYSLYDTVVVFDKFTENIAEHGERHPLVQIANLSMNEVLMRSINTSLTSLLPVGSLLFFGSYLLGAATLREFALALFVGIAAGTYSSIFVATPLLTLWKEREPEWQRMVKVAARKGRKSREVVEPEPEPVARVTEGTTPRPPKQRGKKRR